MRKKNNSLEPYIHAIKEFVKETIYEPNFFNLPPEKQREIAKSYIDKHKIIHKAKQEKSL